MAKNIKKEKNSFLKTPASDAFVVKVLKVNLRNLFVGEENVLNRFVVPQVRFKIRVLHFMMFMRKMKVFFVVPMTGFMVILLK